MTSAQINLGESRAIPHPSNNSVFIVDGSQIYQFDNNNEILVQKPCFPQIRSINRQAITYNEGYIYLIGGCDSRTAKAVKSCSRYNIVTEKWQQLTTLLFEIMDSSACAINEQQIAVAGGSNSHGRFMDIVQIYDIRENSWRLFDICLSSPRR